MDKLNKLYRDKCTADEEYHTHLLSILALGAGTGKDVSILKKKKAKPRPKPAETQTDDFECKASEITGEPCKSEPGKAVKSSNTRYRKRLYPVCKKCKEPARLAIAAEKASVAPPPSPAEPMEEEVKKNSSSSEEEDEDEEDAVGGEEDEESSSSEQEVND